MTSIQINKDVPALEERSSGWQRFVKSSTPYWFIAPFFVGFIIFQLLPIIFSGVLSFTEWDGMKAIQLTGLDNFKNLFADARFWNAFRNTLWITLACSIFGTAGSMALAILLEKVPDRLSSLLRVVFFLPSVTSVVVVTFVFKQLYSTDNGFLNVALTQLGLPTFNWLNDPKLALLSLIVMLIWAGLGWDALIITAGLRSIPEEIYDAGRVDGASGWGEFLYITLPLLRPTLTFVLVTSVIYLWGMFSQPQLLTAGGPLRATQTIALYLYEAGFRYHKFGYASAIAIMLSLVMFISSYLSYRLTKSDVRY
ncbi:MAG: sugar ABC transporter permease [Bellilinea sp.]